MALLFLNSCVVFHYMDVPSFNWSPIGHLGCFQNFYVCHLTSYPQPNHHRCYSNAELYLLIDEKTDQCVYIPMTRVEHLLTCLRTICLLLCSNLLCTLLSRLFSLPISNTSLFVRDSNTSAIMNYSFFLICYLSFSFTYNGFAMKFSIFIYPDTTFFSYFLDFESWLECLPQSRTME